MTLPVTSGRIGDSKHKARVIIGPRKFHHQLREVFHHPPLFAGAVALLVAAAGLTYAAMQPLPQNEAGLVAASHTKRPAATSKPGTTPSPTPGPSLTPALQAPATTATPTTPPAPASRYGISAGNTLPGLSSGDLAARLNDFKALGIGWVRLDLDWNDIQRDGPSNYNWTRFDAVVAAANARGLRLLPIITYTAPWARSSACRSSPTCAPANPAQFATFAAAATSRYASRGIHQWEIWNEPNQAGFWGPAANAAGYTALLRAAYPAIKRADPSATVVSGGIASTETSDGNIAQLEFLAAMYANGAAGSMDAVGYHPYSFPVPPTYPASWNAWSKMASTTPSFRSIMAAHGDGAKQIWITEYGAPTNGPEAGATVNNYNLTASPDHVDEAYQAALATQFVRATAALPWTGPAFWYSYKDGGTDPATTENFYGLIRANGSHKPSYDALKTEIARYR